jgi:hypothetical protein
MRAALSGLRLVTVVLGFACSRAAAADDVPRECARVAEQAQQLRSRAHFLEAREQLLLCVRDECPKVIVQDCTRWQVEVEAALPSLVFGARDERGNDISDVHVSIDGRRRLDQLDGTATPIDPGMHSLKFERPGGATPIEVEALIREGEKRRLISVQWDRLAGGPSWPRPEPSSPPEWGATVGTAGTSRPIAGYVLFGAGAVVGAIATYALVSGLNAKSDLRAGCGATATGCSESQIRFGVEP